MLYLDTSLLVSALVPEPHSTSVEEWLARQDPLELAISDWVVTEFSSALSMKVRTRAIDGESQRRILDQFSVVVTKTLRVFPVSQTSFRTAADFCDRSLLNLRSSDALHIAVCAEHGAAVCTLDRTMADAAQAFAVSVVRV
jgi:uncharacterized protein